ncbi:MAG: hypothetical protein H7249_05975 [Chitinophagaceae bacterium]|nr:hypothetical protein [Oligoflexus sp.]
MKAQALLLVMLVLTSACKPVNESNSTEKASSSPAVTKFDIMSANVALLSARIKNYAALVFHSSPLPGLPPVIFANSKILWKFSEYLIEEKKKANTTVEITKTAGSVAAPGGTATTPGTVQIFLAIVSF